MFGSFLPNLWSSCNQSVRSREPTLLCNQSYRPRASDRTMVDTFQPRSLSCFRHRKRRHDNEMNLEKEKGPRVSQHHMGWNVQRTFPLLPVAGEMFLLTFPLIEVRPESRLNDCLAERIPTRPGLPWPVP